MKKNFPIIIVLISLSLIGIIVIQVNWFKNQLVIQQERFIDRVDKAGLDVAEELSKHAMTGGLKLGNKRQGLQLFLMISLLISEGHQLSPTGIQQQKYRIN